MSGYLGPERAKWRKYDCCALIEDGAGPKVLLVDQGLGDQFLSEQLKPDALKAACQDPDIHLTLCSHAEYDHSYYFISTFLADHIEWHAIRSRG